MTVPTTLSRRSLYRGRRLSRSAVDGRRFIEGQEVTPAMKHKELLTVLSLLAIVLVAMHIADDYVHGFDRSVVSNPYALLILVVWSSSVLLLRDRLMGRIIILLGGLVAIVIPIIHLNGRGYGDEFLKTDGALRFIWTLYMLGTIGTVIVIGALREMVGARTRVMKEK